MTPANLTSTVTSPFMRNHEAHPFSSGRALQAHHAVYMYEPCPGRFEELELVFVPAPHLHCKGWGTTTSLHLSQLPAAAQSCVRLLAELATIDVSQLRSNALCVGELSTNPHPCMFTAFVTERAGKMATELREQARAAFLMVQAADLHIRLHLPALEVAHICKHGAGAAETSCSALLRIAPSGPQAFVKGQHTVGHQDIAQQSLCES